MGEEEKRRSRGRETSRTVVRGDGIPLYLFTSVPLYLCTPVPFYPCTSVPLYLCTPAPLRHYAVTPLFIRQSHLAGNLLESRLIPERIKQRKAEVWHILITLFISDFQPVESLVFITGLNKS